METSDFEPRSVGAAGSWAPMSPPGGGLVISLDFELAWGVHDSRGSEGDYRENLLGARRVIPRLLELFAEYEVPATWATVGLLFAESLEEARAFHPELKPSYSDKRRDPYCVEVGDDEASDPLHYAPSLVKLICEFPGQELASHTYSHYYCLEPGQTQEQFAADLAAAQAIAGAHGYELESIILPRNQVRPDYLPVIAGAGFKTHRSTGPNPLTQPTTGPSSLPVRGLRLLDAYLPLTGANSVSWASTRPDAHGLVDVHESRFLRPVNGRNGGIEGLRIGRLERAMRAASATGSLMHLWWHPHNFGTEQDENLRVLRRLLDLYRELRRRQGFGAYSMKQVGEIARWAELEEGNPSENSASLAAGLPVGLGLDEGS